MRRIAFLVTTVFLFSANSHASIRERWGLTEYQVQKTTAANQQFSQISSPGFVLSQVVGAPQLPMKVMLLAAHPKDVKVALTVHRKTSIKNFRPYPAQEQDCRCVTDKVKSFAFDQGAYQTPTSAYRLIYIGDFRGQPITRLEIPFARYESTQNKLVLLKDVSVSVNVDSFEMPKGDYRDYLLIGPKELMAGTQEFTRWKQSQGYKVYTEALSQPQMTKEVIREIIKAHYQQSGIDFVIMIGDESNLPMFMVDTTGSYQTPSDLPYFTMEGQNDHFPDMLTSRIPAQTVSDVTSRFDKILEFERKAQKDPKGFNRFIGIASNEGSSPSDDEYVRAIGERFHERLGMEALHLQQDDAQNSNPRELNKALDSGALWLTYLGHGSGSSWPSMNQTYDTGHIRQINNAHAVKPIIIDVACQNGRLMNGYLGTTFSSVDLSKGTQAFGASAYFGGSVNIAWHPPAVMAQGIAFEHLEKNFRHLGEALLAGQLYLAKKWGYEEDVIDNLEWYHLQGDPGMIISY